MNSLKKFIIQFSHFFTGNVLSILLGFITFPILTRALTIEQYGVFGLVTTTMLLAVAVGKLGISNGIIRFYEEYSKDFTKQTIFVTTIITNGFIFSLITVLLYLLFIPLLKKIFEFQSDFTMCFIVMASYLFIRPLNIIVLNMLRVNDKTKFFNVINLIGKILSIGLSLVIFFYFIKQLFGFFIGVATAEFLISIILFSWFFSRYKIKYRQKSHKLIKKLLKFGLPLLLTELLYLMLTYADRYMIVAITGKEALGIYSVGYNLAMYIGDLITFALSYAIIPLYVQIYERDGKKETEIFLEHCFHFLLIAVIPICFGYYVVAPELFKFLASEKYIPAASFSPIILLGTILLGLNNVLNAGLFIKKKSIIIMNIMLCAVFLNIMMNLLLIPSYGEWGAAVATLIASMVIILLSVYLSFKYIKIRVDLRVLILHLALSILMVIVVMQFNISELWINLTLKILSGAAIVTLGIFAIERNLLIKLKEFRQ